MNHLEGISVVITGGSKGIGRGIAQHLFDQGAQVVICSRNHDEVISVAREIDKDGTRCVGIAADVSLPDDAKKVIECARTHFGKIDVLINNAGTIGEANLFENTDLTRWNETIATNLFGTVNMSHAVIPYMKEKGAGTIINLAGAGIGSKNPLTHFSSYFTSKMAVAGFTEVIAKELSGSNICVNAIAPGAINTNITDYVLQEGKEKVGEAMYIKTLKQKEEGGDSLQNVYTLIDFLVSDESRNVSGKVLSAKWDKLETLKTLQEGDSLFTLRRIDNDLFYGK
jgi:NAD(P)-dependent dehydrogenase (short-subunit alcohol dehydrogenase family)